MQELFYQANQLRQQGDWLQAQSVLEQLLANCDDANQRSQAYLLLGELRLLNMDRDGAVRNFCLSIEANSNNGVALGKLPHMGLPTEKLREVIEEVEATVLRSTTTKANALCLAALYQRVGEVEQSSIWLRRARREHFADQNIGASELDLSAEECGPNFLIIGAMKGGTTSLFNYLCQHPKIVEPLKKEVQYFQNSELSPEWYQLHFFAKAASVVGRPIDELITGEASPGYYCYPIVERILQEYPHIKLIFTLRNPIRRAVSHYYHTLGYRAEVAAAGSLESIMFAGVEEIAKILQLPRDQAVGRISDIFNSNTFLAMGLYDLLLKPWVDAVGINRIHFVCFDELVLSPQTCVNRVFDFLGVGPCEGLKFSIHNQGSYEVDMTQEKFKVLEDLFRPSIEAMRQHYGVNVGKL